MTGRAAGLKGVLAAMALAVLTGVSGCGGAPGSATSAVTADAERTLLRTTDPEALSPLLLTSSQLAQLPAAAEAASQAPDTETTAIPVAADSARCPAPTGSACVYWNEVTRTLVAGSFLGPTHAARVYALLSVAQHEALVSLWMLAKQHGGHGQGVLLLSASDGPGEAAEHATVAAASSRVLGYLFPEESRYLAAAQYVHHQHFASLDGGGDRKHIALATGAGKIVGAWVVDYARHDGSDAVYAGTPPTGPGYYTGDLLTPLWGEVRPWLLESGSQFRADPPPAFGSPAFQEALNEVRQVAATRTPEQLRLARHWDDPPGTYSNTGHFNALCCELMAHYRLGERGTARVLALLNMAMMDASVAAWDTKYTYWLLRPYQADPGISVPIFEPPFPSYASGHATFGGAFERVMSHFLPQDAATFHYWAEENAVSRLYGGVHYRFDSEVGLWMGRTIGDWAIQRIR